MRFCEAKWEFCKLPSVSCRVSRAGARITRAHPLTPSHASTKRGRIAPRHGRGAFSVSKGGLRGLGCRLGRRWTVATGDHRPFASPHGGEVSPAGSVGVGKAPPALNASPVPPPTRRKFLSCREFRGCETRPSKSNGSETWLVRTSPRKGPLSSGLPQKGFQRGMKSRLPARSAMDGRHWRPSPPFEMRCIELSSPPVAARLPLLENEINGRGQGVGSLPCVVFSKGDSPPLKNSQPGLAG